MSWIRFQDKGGLLECFVSQLWLMRQHGMVSGQSEVRLGGVRRTGPTHFPTSAKELVEYLVFCVRNRCLVLDEPILATLLDKLAT